MKSTVYYIWCLGSETTSNTKYHEQFREFNQPLSPPCPAYSKVMKASSISSVSASGFIPPTVALPAMQPKVLLARQYLPVCCILSSWPRCLSIGRSWIKASVARRPSPNIRRLFYTSKMLSMRLRSITKSMIAEKYDQLRILNQSVLLLSVNHTVCTDSRNLSLFFSQTISSSTSSK